MVDARYTSFRNDPNNGPKGAGRKCHLCPNCGLKMDRDINACLNIRAPGLGGEWRE
ncbi:MAG: zinc ribbon domain-containing protein [Methanothrix sp.]|nr:zinc ribbon domain-containing protein [Methanothrix sp.]